MARPASRYPTELELQILKILWEQSAATAQQVRSELATAYDRTLARTSVVTTLNVMVDKQIVDRQQQGKAYVFTPRVTEQEICSGMLGDLLQRVFDGSAEALVLNLLDSEQISDAEHEALRRLINERDRQKESP